MFREVLSYIWNFLKSRLFVMCLIFSALFFIIGVRLFQLQIVNSDSYLNNYIQKSEKERYTVGTRGSIFDKNGKLLAYNEVTYAINIEDTLDSSKTKDSELNELVYNLISIIEKNKDKITLDFPITRNGDNEVIFSPTISENTRLKFLKNVYGVTILDTEEKQLSLSTALEVYNYLKDDLYEISDEYPTENILKMMMIRYNLSLNAYKKYVTTTIATDVSNETVAAIYENEDILPGVSVSEETIRKYNESIYFSHIVGYTGKISEEQLVELNSNGGNYSTDDIVGKSGIEASMETTLSGEKGKEIVITDNTGKVLSILEHTNEVAGKDIYLTIDADLQKATYYALEKSIAECLLEYIVNSDETIDSHKNVLIPIKDVYFQLINNNVIDITRLNKENATYYEKDMYSIFSNKQAEVLSTISQQMSEVSSLPFNQLSAEYQDYYEYIYDKLSSSSYDIIVSDYIDESDSIYTAWENGTISFSEFLNYAVSMNWINSAYLSTDSKYADSEQVYNSLMTYITKSISNDKAFNKLIYKYLIKYGIISGNEVCLLLYEQSVLEYNETQYNRLATFNSYSAYQFMREQIQYLSITPAQLALKPCSGSSVVTDVNTGDVIAMVTYPSYDNNLFSGAIDSNTWERLTEDLSIPLYNRATRTRLAPGSTFKMLTASAGLEENVITVGETVYTSGIFDKITPSPKCWIYPGRHGNVNVVYALQQSCNCFFYETGYRLGKLSGTFSHAAGLEVLRKYGELYGLTTKSGVEIEETEPSFSTENIVTSAIGQGTNAFTPTQISRYVSTVANGGTNYTLTLLDKIKDTQGNVVAQNEPKVANILDFSQTTWDALHLGMRQVITNGSVYAIFRNFPIEVAGKTGTAQENLKEACHGIFVCYAPYEKPEISVTTVIQNGYASTSAARVAYDVLSYYFGLCTIDDILK